MAGERPRRFVRSPSPRAEGGAAEALGGRQRWQRRGALGVDTSKDGDFHCKCNQRIYSDIMWCIYKYVHIFLKAFHGNLTKHAELVAFHREFVGIVGCFMGANQL